MIKSCFVMLLCVSAFVSSALAQDVPTENSTIAKLEACLTMQASSLLSKRRAEVAAIKAPEQIAARQRKLKRFFVESLGDLPQQTPLHPRVVGTRQYSGYRVERIIFESRPRHHVTAVLYLPDGKPPFPGVLVPCGHTATGKAGDTYQRICILLAKNGMAAFCYDPIGQGERVQMLDEKGKPAIREGSTTEHTMAGIGALLIGRQAASYRIWDGLRAMDYLAGRSEIDKSKLGCTGNSGGGTMTSYLMALDERIAAAVPSCYITSLDRLFKTIGPQDAEQNITGQVEAGMDHADYIIMRAPKPTLISVGTQDFFDIQGSWDTFREVKLLYGRLGFGERVDIFESDEPHGFTGPRRVAATRWLRRWLLGKDDAITETETAIAPDSELQCTKTGQVLSDLGGVSVFDLNAEREKELRQERSDFLKWADAHEGLRSWVRTLLGLDQWPIIVVPRGLPPTEARQCNGFKVREWRIRTESEIPLYLNAVDLVPEWPDRSAPIVVKIGFDIKTELAPGGPAEQLARRGRRVVLASLRGMGDRPESKDSPLGRDVRAAFLSLHIRRPLLGQRVADVLSLLESLKAEAGGPAAPPPAPRGQPEPQPYNPPFPGFEIQATGPSSLAVLHAAVLDSDEEQLIRRIVLDHCLVSWADVVQRAICREQLGSVIPGVLQYYDIPDLVARLDPFLVDIRDPVDALGRPVADAKQAEPARKK